MDSKEKTKHVASLLEEDWTRDEPQFEFRLAAELPPEPVALNKGTDVRFYGTTDIVKRSRDPTWRSSHRRSLFSIFNEENLQEAFEHFKNLYSEKNFDAFIERCRELRGILGKDMFLYVYYSTVFHRDDCKDVPVSPIEQVVPHWFFSAETISEAIQKALLEPDVDHIIKHRSTSETSKSERRLAYFREDIAISIHHWVWHIIYPARWDEELTGKIKDRRGELFQYMHQQMLARYDCERLSNGLSPVEPLKDFQEELVGYFPHLSRQPNGDHMACRTHGLMMKDHPEIDIQEMERWRSRILDGIDLGYVLDNNDEKISIKNIQGIDILGRIVEADGATSVNRGFYGNLHNMGHVLLATAHDPGLRLRRNTDDDEAHRGVMYFPQTAARDPIFYRWHKYIDQIFQRHKATLAPYTRDELLLPGIEILSAKIKDTDEDRVIKTFMKTDVVDISRVEYIKPNRDRKMLIEYEHLSHEPFSYEIIIRNDTGRAKQVTVRIFLGPKYDEFGNILTMNERRQLMIELDKFQKKLSPGENTVNRDSSKSSVTLKRKKVTREQLMNQTYEPEPDYCNCGWPDHLLIPRGSREGTDFVLFVMCTNYADDMVDDQDNKIYTNDVRGRNCGRRNFCPSRTSTGFCGKAISYCGSKDQKYPDKKPMGYPFDRRINDRTENDEFWTMNMIANDIKMKFIEQVFDE